MVTGHNSSITTPGINQEVERLVSKGYGSRVAKWAVIIEADGLATAQAPACWRSARQINGRDGGIADGSGKAALESKKRETD